MASTYQRTCIWLGDSLDSFVSDGDANDLTTHIIEQERNVAIRNLSTPGATLGRSNGLGYNSTWTTDTLDHVCGPFRYCHCLVVTVGVNDFFSHDVTWTSIEESLARILDYARDHEINVLMPDLIWFGRAEDSISPTSGWTFAEYRDRRAEVCARYQNCRFVRRPRQFDTEQPDLFGAAERATGELLHPNSEGHRIRATWIGDAGDGWIWSVDEP